MPAKRELTMRQLRYMLRLHHDGVSAREIGRTLGVARSTIQDNLRRAQASGIAPGWCESVASRLFPSTVGHEYMSGLMRKA
jgi:IS30 family transposase